MRPLIVEALAPLQDVEVIVYEPTKKYQNVAKREGVQTLTAARALVTELIRRYWILGIECTVLEVQKLAYFLEREVVDRKLNNPLDLSFSANQFGPFSPKLRYLLDALDGSYLHCDKRLADAGPFDVIGYDESKMEKVALYIRTEAKEYTAALDATSKLIEGYESPLGMELLATVDWLLHVRHTEATVEAVKAALRDWPGGKGAGERKLRLFNERMIERVLARLRAS